MVPFPFPAVFRCNPADRRLQIFFKVFEIAAHCLLPANENIIPAGLAVQWNYFLRSRPQAPFDAIASHGVADLLCHGKSDAGYVPPGALGGGGRLQHKARGRPFATNGSDAKKIRPLFKSFDAYRHGLS